MNKFNEEKSCFLAQFFVGKSFFLISYIKLVFQNMYLKINAIL